ncbi:MAG: cupin domain-containing protein [Alphaproteobacteria bacterium]|nr:cupin domain-containing protein [Alphaproteobacteria bacterium]
MHRAFALAALVVGSALFISPVFAGECPPDQVKANVTKPVDFKAIGVTDTVLGTNDLSKEPIKAPGRVLRLRRLVIQPGGIVPWHSHDDRPAMIYIVEGQINEYNSNCSVPIVHKTGDVARETFGTAHWWKNTTDKPVVLLSFDILHDPNDHNM